MARIMSTGAWVGGKLLFSFMAVMLILQVPELLSPPPAAISTPVAPAPAAPAPEEPALTLASVTDASGSPFTIRQPLALDRPMTHGDYAWNEEGVPEGELFVLVDLAAQTLYVYRGGVEIGRSVILYGADDKPTPTGTFPISQKSKDHVSNIYGVPMPYMLRLTNDGIAIHASTVDYGSATHGCVGVPEEFAALLFAEASLGDTVTVIDGGGPDTGGVPAGQTA